jgi:integrase
VHALEHGSYAEPSKQTVGEFLVRWLQSYAKPNVAPLTYQRYRQIVHGRLLRDLGSIPLAKLKPQHIIDAYGKWAQETTPQRKPLSARSILHHHRVLSEALGHAVKWQALVANPALAVVPPKVERAPITTLDLEQARAVLDAAMSDETAYGAAAAVALSLGLRLGEVLGLTWPDVDLEHGQLSVRQSLQQIRGQGLVLRPPKTRRSVRTVSLPPQAVQVLRLRQHAQKVERVAAGPAWSDQGLVLTTAAGGPLSPVSVRRHYQSMLKLLGITDHIRFHDLRHTHATLMLIMGEHPKVVSERLGHATVGITLDTYSHVLPNLQQQAADRFGKLLEAPSSSQAGTI